MSEKRIALFLVDETNEFHRLLRADADEAARRAGLHLATRFSGCDVASQLSMLQACLDGVHRPDAVIVMSVHDRGLERFVRRAVHAGSHVVLLNAVEDDLDAIRSEQPRVALATVCADEIETGRIQGRQFRQLLPAGGSVLYIQGRVRSLTARCRTEGVDQAVRGAAIDLVRIEAGWTPEEGHDAATAWLRVGLRASRHIDLIGCQNDMLAKGALEALREVAAELGRPEVARIPVTGCDGSPGVGQGMVNRGELRATVVLPRNTGPAVEMLARVLRTGEMPPPLLTLQPTSFPAEPLLSDPGAGAVTAAG